MTDEGWEKIEGLLGIGNIADPENWDLKHHVETAIKAHSLYRRDVQYVVKDGEVIIVDEFTGRLMPGRRWSDGLHQAVEAKEGVNIRREDQTLATITFQNYFRLYKKLAGMTGTAETEASEFDKHLQAGHRGDSDEQADAAAGERGRGVPDGEGKVLRRGGRDCGAAREPAAGAGGHDVD